MYKGGWPKVGGVRKKENRVKAIAKRNGRIGRMGVALALVAALFSGCATSRMIRAGDEHAKAGDWAEAYGVYAEALKRDPFHPRLKQKIADSRAQAAKIHADRAAALLGQGNIAMALEEVKRAVEFDPNRAEYRSLAEKILKKNEGMEALAIAKKLANNDRYYETIEILEEAIARDPDFAEAKAARDEAVKKRREQSEVADSLSLKSRKPITLNFQNTKLKEVFGVLEKLSGINIIFDKDVKDDPVTVYANEVTFSEALNLIFSTNGLFMKKISDQTILIAPKTKQKADQYQDLLIRTFYLSHAKAKEMVNLLRTMLETRRIYANEEANTITVRDAPEKVALAEKIVEANDRAQAEVVLAVELLEVKRTKGEVYGLQLAPQAVSGFVQLETPKGGTAPKVGTVPVDRLDDISRSSIFAVLPSVSFDFFKQESEAQVLANPRVRVLDNKVAKIKIGDRVPILLSSTNSTSGATPTSTTTTSIEFKDVGIDMTLEPSIHLEDDMTLKVKIDVTSLGDRVELGEGKSQFQFGQRSTETVLSVRSGETVVISGLLRDDDRETVLKIPGLGDIPYLGRLFSRTDKGRGKTDIVLSITPQVIRAKTAPSKPLQAFWSGTEEAYGNRPLFSDLSVLAPQEGAPPPPHPLPPFGAPPFPDQAERGARDLPDFPGPRSPAASLITFVPAETSIPVNGEVTVGVRIDQVNQLSAAHLVLEYDPAVLTVKKTSEGDFLKMDGAPTRFVSSNPAGTIDLQVERTGDTRGMTGSGMLFTVTFGGVGAGAGKIEIRSASMIDVARRPVHAGLAPATITVK